MPTNTYTYAFGGTPTGTHGKPGVTGIQGYGDRWQILFNGTWAANEKYGTSAFDYSVGSINFFAASLTPNYCTTFKNRVYIGAGTQFNFSENGAPTEWEQQSPGAGFFSYLSYFGGQDLVYSISQLQGRLVVVGRRSVQLWTVDADPASFALVQEMDNVGSLSALATQNIGDFDVIILDDTGFRSLRTREVTLNAYVDDIGVAIDSLVQTDLTAVSAATCCAIVEPTTTGRILMEKSMSFRVILHLRFRLGQLSYLLMKTMQLSVPITLLTTPISKTQQRSLLEQYTSGLPERMRFRLLTEVKRLQRRAILRRRRR